MAPPLVVPSGAYVSLYWSLNDQLAINRLGALVVGTATFSQALAERLGSGIKSAFNTGLAARMAPTTSLLRVGVRDLRTVGQQEFIDTGATAPGTGTGDALPNQTALCVTLRTATVGKSSRGRIYFGGYDELQNGPDGTIVAGCETTTLGFVSSIAAVMSADSLNLAVVQRPSWDIRVVETTTHTDGTVTTRTISHTVAKPGVARGITASESRNSTWETQRRRNNGRGASVIGALMSGIRVPINE